jgi:hypothetical protein
MTIEVLKRFKDKYCDNKDIDVVSLIEAGRDDVKRKMERDVAFNEDAVFGFVRVIGDACVNEIYKNVGEEYGVIYEINDIKDFPNIMVLYLACLIDNINPHSPYGVILKFRHKEDLEIFDEYSDSIFKSIYSENPLVSISKELIQQ